MMIDVFVRMATTPVLAGVVAASVRASPGADPVAPRHQVVTLFGEPTVTHLAWAVAAASYGRPDAVWQISADGIATAAESSLAAAVLRDAAAALLITDGAQLRAAIAHLLSVCGRDDHSSAIRVPIAVDVRGDVDDDALLALLREAEGDIDVDGVDPVEDELAA